jgi:hypothetical protein
MRASLVVVTRAKKAEQRDKLPLPQDWLEAMRKKAAGPPAMSDRELGRLVGVGNSTIHRFWKGAASWDTVVRVAEALKMPLPLLVHPLSPAGHLELLRQSNPAEYTRALERLYVNQPAPEPKAADSSEPIPDHRRPH